MSLRLAPPGDAAPSTALVPFDFEGATVRVTPDASFVLTDVCKVLEIGNAPMAANRLKSDEKDTITLTDSVGRPHQNIIISEAGFDKEHKEVLRIIRELEIGGDFHLSFFIPNKTPDHYGRPQTTYDMTRDGKPVANSKNIAAMFDKEHKNILRDIRELEIGSDLSASFFIPNKTPDHYGRPQTTYDMTRDGFTLLAMGFNGPKALQFKLAYIKAFNDMEAALRGPAQAPAAEVSRLTKEAELVEKLAEKKRLKHAAIEAKHASQVAVLASGDAAPSTALVPFDFEGATVRVTPDASPWFVLADVCKVLEIKNAPDAAARLKPDEKGSIALTDRTAAGGNPNVTIISEAGFYRLVLRSDKPAADRFQSWVVKDVLPSIRKAGSYTISQPQTEAEIMASALRIADATLQKQAGQIAELGPKARAFEELEASEGSFNRTEAAKMLNIGARELCQWLRDNDWTCSYNIIHVLRTSSKQFVWFRT